MFGSHGLGHGGLEGGQYFSGAELDQLGAGFGGPVEVDKPNQAFPSRLL